MNYETYIDSHIWRTKARQRKEMDNHQCQVRDLLREIAILLPSVEVWECTEDLEVHHKQYPDQFGEEPLESLITVCSRCHEMLTIFERSFRFLHKAQRAADPRKEERDYGNYEAPNPRSPSFEATQWDVGKSIEPVRKAVEGRHIQEEQNDRGLRTDRPYRVLGRSLPPARISLEKRPGIRGRHSGGDAPEGPDRWSEEG